MRARARATDRPRSGDASPSDVFGSLRHPSASASPFAVRAEEIGVVAAWHSRGSFRVYVYVCVRVYARASKLYLLVSEEMDTHVGSFGLQ